MLGNVACPHNNFNEFELEPTNSHQICILGFSELVLKTGVIDFNH